LKNISFKETFDLTDDPFDEDSKFSKTFSFTVADDVAPSVYPITSKITFDDGKEIETETVDLVVRACDVDSTPAAAEEEEEAEEEARKMDQLEKQILERLKANA